VFTIQPESIHCKTYDNGHIKDTQKHTELDDRKVSNGSVANFSVKNKKHFDRHAPTIKKDKKHQKKMVVFFRDYYFRFVTNLITQRLILPVFVGIVVFFAYEASSLEPDNENVCIHVSFRS